MTTNLETTNKINSAQWQAANPPLTTAQKIKGIVAGYTPISLDEMDGVALMNRTDTKFVMRVDHLIQALSQLTGTYRALSIRGRRLHHYRSRYYDTPDFKTYIQHHDGLRSRYKVRIREYADPGISYLEVKRKNNKNRTIKKRSRISDLHDSLTSGNRDFVSNHYPYEVGSLVSSLWNDFYRITLVSSHRVERLTLDINLQFGDHRRVSGLPGIAIAEVKQDGFSMDSDFIQQMRIQGIRPSGFSKYCIGIAKINGGLKRNRFKSRLLMVDKLIYRSVVNNLPHTSRLSRDEGEKSHVFVN